MLGTKLDGLRQVNCKSVLIVEDDPDIRQSLKDAIDLEGFKTLEAANGVEGLQALHRADRPCLVLLDLMMPVMNGWDFLKAMRSDDLLATVPVLVVTAFSRAPESSDNVVKVLKKPVDLEALLKFVHRHCDPLAARAAA